MTPLEKKNIDSLTVVELKEELKIRGSPVNGRKKDLLERLKSVLADGNEERSAQDDGVVHPPHSPAIPFPSLAEPISQEADGEPAGTSVLTETPDARMVDTTPATETENLDVASGKDVDDTKQGISVVSESPDTAMADQLKPMTQSEPPAGPDSNVDAAAIPGLESRGEATVGDEKAVLVEEEAVVEEEEEALVQLDAPELEMQAIEEEKAMEEAQESKKRREESKTGDDEPAKRQRTDEAPSHNSEADGRPSAAAQEPVPPVQVPHVQSAWPNSKLPTANGSGALRVVPPSPDPPSPSIRIDHLLRPFHTRTLEQLLAKTGTVEHFWIDAIKSHCYVTYASEGEAIATREALFNRNWPEQGGKKLAVKFVPTDDVKTRLGLLTAPALEGGERRGVGGAEADGVASGGAPLEGETPGAGVGVGAEEKGVNGVVGAGVKEVFTVRNTAMVEPAEEESLPTLDDLFRKTKARPQVYYLPLSEDQVSAKLVAQKKTPSVQVES